MADGTPNRGMRYGHATGIAVLRDGELVEVHDFDNCVLCQVMRGEVSPESYGIEQPYGIPRP